MIARSRWRSNILEIIRAWGGNDAVDAAKRGDADSVKQAIARQSHRADLTLTPATQRTLINNTDFGARIRSRLGRPRDSGSMDEARARIQASVASPRGPVDIALERPQYGRTSSNAGIWGCVAADALQCHHYQRWSNLKESLTMRRWRQPRSVSNKS